MKQKGAAKNEIRQVRHRVIIIRYCVEDSGRNLCICMSRKRITFCTICVQWLYTQYAVEYYIKVNLVSAEHVMLYTCKIKTINLDIDY